MEDEKASELKEKAGLGFWEKPDDKHTVLCIVTSWATEDEDVDRLIDIL